MVKPNIKEIVEENKIVVFSKTYCPYCKMAKKALQDAGASDFKVFELDNMSDGAAYQDALRPITRITTVPQVFINGKCVGGGSDVKQLQQEGKLKKMIS